MKFYRLIPFLTISLIFAFASCKKNYGDNGVYKPAAGRKIQYSIYTDNDFSSDIRSITFSLIISNASNQIIWDSTLAPIKISEIPDSLHRLIFDKYAPDNSNGLLKVGFLYSIANGGHSSFTDTSSAGQVLKVVNFNFH